MIPRTAALLLLAVTSVASGQGDPAGKPSVRKPPVLLPSADGKSLQVMAPAEGIEVTEFLDVWSDATGQRFTYTEPTFRGRSKVQLSGVVPVPRDDLDFLFQGILVMHGFALVPAGPPNAKLFKVEQVESSRVLKQRAPYVPRAGVKDLVRQPARVFMTSFALDQVEVQSLRGALQQLLTNRAAEFVQEIQASNTVVVVGFGPTLAAVDDLLRSVDRPLPEKVKETRDARMRPRGK